MLENEQLILLNNFESIRINPTNGEFSNIALKFASSSLALRIKWKVLCNITSSDHFPIMVQIISLHNDITNDVERWNLK